MSSIQTRSPSEHSFHIPVMGTGYTNTTPLEVAPFGVTSVMSLVDDTLLEQERKVLSQKFGVEYTPIGPKEDDFRCRRVLAYLNVISDEVDRRFAELKASPFQPGSPITRYFELLPECESKSLWRELASLTEPTARAAREALLRERLVMGQPEANIMTKLDSSVTLAGKPKPPEQSDAVAALRGFAMSRLRSAIVLSAGMNQRLFAAAATFDAFFPNAEGQFEKGLCLKVSDFRSAEIQGKMLARKGLWVSEYRVESGLNCGGHAFPTEGLLTGPIMDDFRRQRGDLAQKLYAIFAESLREQGRPVPAEPPPFRVTMQGGVGNAAEHRLLMERYEVDGVGWGSPFLLCPEVIAIDDDTVGRLLAAKPGDVQLSPASPLGVPFWNLMTSAGEDARRARNDSGNSGSSCPRGYLVYNTDFTDVPICTASRNYHNKLRAALPTLSPEVGQRKLTVALNKSCLCQDLAGGAQRRLGIDKDATPLLCCGPNVVYFRKVVGFDEMVGHIYGRNNVLPADSTRPHIFINEFELYANYLEQELAGDPPVGPRVKWLERYKKGLEAGAVHLRQLAADGHVPDPAGFVRAVDALEKRCAGIAARAAEQAAVLTAPAAE